jgi:hypothetical protein
MCRNWSKTAFLLMNNFAVERQWFIFVAENVTFLNQEHKL